MKTPSWERKMIEFAKTHHAGQRDDAGQDYFTAHCVQVANIVKLLSTEKELICAAYGHDLFEDTEATKKEIRELFKPKNEYNIDAEKIIDYIMEVTKVVRNGKKTFPRLHSQSGILLKFADRSSNLSRMSAWSERKRRSYMDSSTFWSK